MNEFLKVDAGKAINCWNNLPGRSFVFKAEEIDTTGEETVSTGEGGEGVEQLSISSTIKSSSACKRSI